MAEIKIGKTTCQSTDYECIASAAKKQALEQKTAECATLFSTDAEAGQKCLDKLEAGLPVENASKVPEKKAEPEEKKTENAEKNNKKDDPAKSGVHAVWHDLRFGLGMRFLGHGVRADKYAVLDGALTGFLDQTTSQNSAVGGEFDVQWTPLHVSLNDSASWQFVLGLQVGGGVTGISESTNIAADINDYKPSNLSEFNIGVVAGFDYRAASGFGAGLMLGGGFMKYWADDLDLGAMGSKMGIDYNGGHVNGEVNLGYNGIHAYFAVGAEFGMNEEIGAMVATDDNYYGVGVGTTKGINWTCTAGLRFILPDLMKFGK